MSAEKKSLRKEYIRRRDGISSSLAMIYANAIRARLWNVAEFTEAHAVSGYHSTGSEVYTGDILRDVLARGTRLCLPRTGQNDTINFYEISDMDSLQIGKYGILEPHDRCKQCTGPRGHVGSCSMCHCKVPENRILAKDVMIGILMLSKAT